MRELIRSVVEAVGTVFECASGEAALECYGSIRPDWVLMDVRLGGMDGIAATRAIRKLDPDARVLIVTEYGDGQYRRAAELAGARGFVLKDDLLQLPGLLSSSPEGADGL